MVASLSLGEAETMPEATDVEEPLSMSDKALRVVGVTIILVMALFWIWVLSGAPRKQNPDRLDDREWAAYADERCERLRRDIARLPNALDASTAEARADTLDEANELVGEMLDDLEATKPTSGDDARRLEGWLRDWRLHEQDRIAYADILRRDPKAQLGVTEHPDFNDPIDEVIRVFADVNDMQACRVPGDV